MAQGASRCVAAGLSLQAALRGRIAAAACRPAAAAAGGWAAQSQRLADVAAALHVGVGPPPARRRAGGGAARFAATASSAAAAGDKKRVVFLGTPDVAALVLHRLLDAAAAPGARFEVAAVVTQPGRPRGRGRAAQPSPVAAAAAAAGVPPARLLCPERAGDPAFLDALRALAPDLCVTAAYGCYLPAAFLAVPPAGTLNIHPSLLPAYRGAAPVQRALLDGAAETGVSLLYTVREMDAGPLLAARRVAVGPDEQAPELLARLFALGADDLAAALAGDAVWDGTARAAAAPQDAAAATHAAKLGRADGLLDFAAPAAAVHNRVRALAGWPGTHHVFGLSARAGGGEGELELKVLRTRLAGGGGGWAAGAREVAASPAGDALRLRCGDGGVLELLEVQAPGKRPVGARDFINGLKGGVLHWRERGAGGQ